MAANRFSALSLEDDDADGADTVPNRRRRAAAGGDGRGGGGARGEEGRGGAAPAAAASAPAASVSAVAAADEGAAQPRLRPRPFGHNSMLWLDLEMSGLDPNADHILELACVLSDGGLTTFVEGPNLVVAQPEAVLARMNDWCQAQHGESGLVERVRASTLSLRQAEEAVLTFVKAHAAPGVLNLAGNAVYKDKEFLERHMPELMAALSWRVIDVSTINELAYRWYPSALRRMPRKKGGHRAMADVYESIEELKYYRKALFKPQPLPQPQSSGKR